ncbi:hypothetical protein DV735_g3608, partial [Chaetothyriales sp. CBS 134920]
MADIDASPDAVESPGIAAATPPGESSVDTAQADTQNSSFTESSQISDTPLVDSRPSPDLRNASPSSDLHEGPAVAQTPTTETEHRSSVKTNELESRPDSVPLESRPDSVLLESRPDSGPAQIIDSPQAINEAADNDSEGKSVKGLEQPLSPSPSQLPPIKSGEAGTIQLQTAKVEMAPPPKGPRGSKRRAKNYTLEDGTVVSGKGLGRGRPGIKRGPRSVKVEDGSVASGTESPAPSTAKTPGSRQMSKKRKRTLSAVSNEYSPRSSHTSDSRESSPEYNPTGTTRSGRVTQKPTSVVAQVPENTGTPTKRSRVSSSTTTTTAQNGAKSHRKIKRRVYRGREQLALCEHCLRGYGPPGNVIVFCDACNKCWHQRCHDPQVPAAIIADTKAQWFCAECDRILHGKKNSKAKAAAPSVVAAPAPADTPPTFADPLVPGSSLTSGQKTAYLESLSKDELIRTLLRASELAPTLALFKMAVPSLPAAKFHSTYTTPASATPIYHSAAHAAKADDGVDEGYETYVDEHALLYPRPGYGIKLPPEKEDMHMLLESRDSRTFSHWVVGVGGAAAEFSGTGDVRRAGPSV